MSGCPRYEIIKIFHNEQLLEFFIPSCDKRGSGTWEDDFQAGGIHHQDYGILRRIFPLLFCPFLEIWRGLRSWEDTWWFLQVHSRER